jgi:hypothetical protein
MWKAYFYWTKGNAIVSTQVFDKTELAVEIRRRRALGEDMVMFEKAYAKL